MASSKVVLSSTSTTNTDLPRQSSICSLSSMIADLQQSDSSKNFASMSMDDLLKNSYSEDQTQTLSQQGGTLPGVLISQQGSESLPKDVASKTVEEVWKEIVAGSDQRRADVEEEMTLEDFLTKTGAVREEEVRVPVMAGTGEYGAEAATSGQFQIQSQGLEGPLAVYGNEIDGRVVGVLGRGKRRIVEEPVDKATQQKQRRMIKNRESAARSRERKQAYTVELETLVSQLEEENARLLREEAEWIKERRKQLKENIVQVVAKRKPSVLRRVHSMEW